MWSVNQCVNSGVVKKVCTGTTAEKISQVSSYPNKNPSGTDTGILDCLAGSTASQCADLIKNT